MKQKFSLRTSPVRVTCQVTEVEPTPAISPAREPVVDMIKRLLPTPAPPPQQAAPIRSDRDLLHGGQSPRCAMGQPSWVFQLGCVGNVENMAKSRMSVRNLWKSEYIHIVLRYYLIGGRCERIIHIFMLLNTYLC